jgi:hypothetical protein
MVQHPFAYALYALAYVYTVQYLYLNAYNAQLLYLNCQLPVHCHELAPLCYHSINLVATVTLLIQRISSCKSVHSRPLELLDMTV